MSRQKAKGTAFETQTVRYFRDRIDDPEGMIHREALHGTKDEGDIKGLYIGGRSVVLECKAHRRFALADWLEQAHQEAANAGADYGMVVFKRPGAGEKSMGDQYVLMDLNTLARLAGAVEGDGDE
ncbi:hypothetical protein CRD60_01005 [Bifidobacterium aemilianum]|uniref:Holliday junction resolvase n=1 Tax=Bifidobacterium aemilianum TaxID=2493120 RepID=A0A366K9P9_9BIFI|nr:hypothetical protein [Bifidobacterium aemilianum]RBP98475.1 hypothetical protein CRD60_01005 [Bifidobacterium aemilianum]